MMKPAPSIPPCACSLVGARLVPWNPYAPDGAGYVLEWACGRTERREGSTRRRAILAAAQALNGILLARGPVKMTCELEQ